LKENVAGQKSLKTTPISVLIQVCKKSGFLGGH
jgi:hypothetical protein